MISVIIPFLNEKESLEELYLRLSVVFKNKNYEFIFINDGSSDGSEVIIEKIIKTDKNVKLINFRKNKGKSSALMSGFNKTKGEVVITMDADLQDEPEEIDKLLNKLNDGYDMVSGWKKNRKDPPLFVLFSKFFNFIIRNAAKVNLHDINCGLKVYRKEAVKSLNLYGDLYRFIPLILAKEGYSVTEVEVSHQPRKYGKSKYGISKFYKGFFDLFTILFLINFQSKPFHLFGSLGIIVFTAGFIICLYLTVIWFEGQSIGRRPLLILGILLIITGIQLFTSGLLAELIISKKTGKEEK